jgi:pre-rRNA-processing protein TSR2
LGSYLDLVLTQSLSEVRQSNFEQAVAYALHLWPALTLAVQNQWGGPDSTDKRDWFAGAVADLFPEISDEAPSKTAKTIEEPELEDVETVLLQIMVDEFDVNVDDDSGYEVATQIFASRAGCVIGDFAEFEKLRTRFLNKTGGKVDQLFKKADDADQDTDWESDDSGDDDNEGGADVEMEDAPTLVSAPKEKPQPKVDEDGFTTVSRKKR